MWLLSPSSMLLIRVLFATASICSSKLGHFAPWRILRVRKAVLSSRLSAAILLVFLSTRVLGACCLPARMRAAPRKFSSLSRLYRFKTFANGLWTTRSLPTPHTRVSPIHTRTSSLTSTSGATSTSNSVTCRARPLGACAAPSSFTTYVSASGATLPTNYAIWPAPSVSTPSPSAFLRPGMLLTRPRVRESPTQPRVPLWPIHDRQARLIRMTFTARFLSGFYPASEPGTR